MSGQRTQWNEATRVQMPALVHLTRIGFTYFGKITEDKAGTVYDPDTNILIEVFKSQFAKLNPERAGEAEAMLRIIRQELDNDDIGESFYKRLKAVSPVRLIDFEHPENNTFHCSAEFTCKRDEDEFRPDITLFVNGLPLVFIEVKKPNNIGGMVAEAERMNKLRFPNKKFRRFINITQLMIFSNNMEYDAMGGIVPIQGVFYCTGSKKGSPFNCFREENPLNLDVAPYNRDFPYKDIDPEVEKQILSDFNNQVIHTSPEYQTNLRTTTPTNRVLTSMCSPDRLLFLLKYGITYYHKTKELDDGTIEQIDQKHIMRYQQFFAAMIVRERISEGTTSGIIWHTQGSGKTALSFHLSYVLTDYFASINKVTKFYFIVDRLDLMKQSKEEFTARGLVVKTASSRAELMEQFRTNQSQEGTTGEPEITVVNIQRFEERQDKVVLPSYATNLQRVFIIDEAHRGYKPEGSFLANLFDADPNSIKIALTGTPLLKSERESWRVFGNYLHTYYYDKSVQDGYTLKIIREDIETSYKEKLEEIYHSLENLVQKKDVKKDDIIEHPNYVKELLRYIITDLKRFRIIRGDDTLGGMVICETSEQARRLFAYFDEIQNELNKDASSKSHFKVGLILYDSDDKDTRENVITDFKDNFKVDMHNIECYDPAAGTGTLLMALAHQIGEDRCTIFAQDRSQKSNKMLKLNLILNGLVSSLDHAIQGDTLTDPFHMSDDGKSLRQFDYEVCNPPFNLDFSETRETLAAMPARFWAGIPNVPKKKKESMSIYTCFLQHVLNSMKPNGKAAIVLPTGFLTAKSSVEGKLLKHIVNERLVYGVISMPSNVFANTGTNVSVVFFDNSKSSDKVILIDASKLGEEYQEGNNKKVRLTPSEIDMIVDTFLNKKTVEDFSVAVSYEDIEAKKCSLAAGQYFDVKVEYVELTQEEFESKMSELTSNLQSYFDEGNVLQKEIMEQLKRVKYEQI